MTDAAFLAHTRESYDAMAADYAERFGSLLDRQPVDRALLGVFAELVRESGGGGGPVADVGCGPGRITGVLADLGLDAFGIDLSPAMVELARKTHPHLRFEVGSMLALDVADASLAGVLAYYSIIHVPWDRRADVFAEFFRVLAPGGYLMLGFQVGDEVRHHDDAWGRTITLDFYRQQPAEVADLVRAAGFDIRTTAERAPEGAEPTPQGYLIAQRPASAAVCVSLLQGPSAQLATRAREDVWPPRVT